MRTAKDKGSNKRGADRIRRRELERRRERRMKTLLMAASGAGVFVVGLLIVIATVRPGGGLISCAPHAVCGNDPMHIHPKLYFYNGATQVSLPENIGVGSYADHSLDQFLDLREGQAGQLAPVHTHAGANVNDVGTIHVEASVTRAFTLGEFFSIWGQPLGPSRTWTFTADATHRLSMKVNGVDNNEWAELVLQDKWIIEIHYDQI